MPATRSESPGVAEGVPNEISTFILQLMEHLTFSGCLQSQTPTSLLDNSFRGGRTGAKHIDLFFKQVFFECLECYFCFYNVWVV